MIYQTSSYKKCNTIVLYIYKSSKNKYNKSIISVKYLPVKARVSHPPLFKGILSPEFTPMSQTSEGTGSTYPSQALS